MAPTNSYLGVISAVDVQLVAQVVTFTVVMYVFHYFFCGGWRRWTKKIKHNNHGSVKRINAIRKQMKVVAATAAEAGGGVESSAADKVIASTSPSDIAVLLELVKQLNKHEKDGEEDEEEDDDEGQSFEDDRRARAHFRESPSYRCKWLLPRPCFERCCVRPWGKGCMGSLSSLVCRGTACAIYCLMLVVFIGCIGAVIRFASSDSEQTFTQFVQTYRDTVQAQRGAGGFGGSAPATNSVGQVFQAAYDELRRAKTK